jgi:hypothetical protein
VKWKDEKRLVYFSSSTRDLSIYPNPAKFSVQLDEEFKNVTGVRFLQGSIPNISEVSSLPFVVLDIAELNHVSMSGVGSSSTAVLQLDFLGAGGFFKMITGASCPSTLRTRREKLQRLEVSLRDPNGDIINMGNESDINPDLQWSCLLELSCSVPNNNMTHSSHAIPFI